jgi:hypothetical protein
MNEYTVPEDVLTCFMNLKSQLKLKLTKGLFYSNMINSYHGITHTTRVLFGTCLLKAMVVL